MAPKYESPTSALLKFDESLVGLLKDYQGALKRLQEVECPEHDQPAFSCRNIPHAPPERGSGGPAGRLRLQMEVWLSGTTGKLHMTTNDPRFAGEINIALKPGLKPDRTFRDALGLTADEEEGDDA